MRYLFICTLLFLGTIANAQPSKQDSLLADAYWKKTIKQDLHSSLRQRYLDSALALQPQNAYFWQQKAMPLFKQQKCEAGMPFLDSAVKYNVQRWLPYRGFMKCMFQRSYRDAIIDLNAAKQMDSLAYIMDHPYDFYLSICYLQLNDINKAEYYINKCISERRKKYGISIDHYMHFFYEGIVAIEKDNYADAIKSFDVAIKQYPHFSDAKYYQAKCYLHLNERGKAVDLFKEAHADITQNHTIAEDNVIHERYPYQIKETWPKSYIESLDGYKVN